MGTVVEVRVGVWVGTGVTVGGTAVGGREVCPREGVAVITGGRLGVAVSRTAGTCVVWIGIAVGRTGAGKLQLARISRQASKYRKVRIFMEDLSIKV